MARYGRGDGAHSTQAPHLQTDAATLGEDVLTVLGDAVSFDFRRIAVDSRRFRELAEAGLAETNVSKLHEAAALCNAEFLTGFELASSPEFEDWASNVRMLHGRLHLRSLRVLTEFYLAAGEWENALSSAGQLVQLDPLNETSHCLVFRAHKASGNASALENAYRTCGQILWRELSVEPSDQTQRLYRSLVNAGPAHVETGITPPAILFASTPSGSVAYTVFGEGVPVVIIPGSICHLEIAWEEPRLQRFLTSLSRTNRVVMFDSAASAFRRGWGFRPRSRPVSPTSRLSSARRKSNAPSFSVLPTAAQSPFVWQPVNQKELRGS
jgi:Bacterial transcriptional activator domain